MADLVLWRSEVGVGDGVPLDLGSGLALEGGLGTAMRLLAIFSLCTLLGLGIVDVPNKKKTVSISFDSIMPLSFIV